MKIRSRPFLILFLVFGVAFIGYVAITYSVTQTLSYGDWGCLDAVLSQEGDRLYVSYCNDNAVKEIDTATMNELRSFNIIEPAYMQMGPNYEYLYVMSLQWPGRLIRIRLVDGQIDELEFEGGMQGLELDSANDRLWVLHCIYPAPDDPVSEWEAVQVENQMSGRLSEVNISNFSIVQTAVISTIPATVLYSPYSDNLYVMHDFRKIIPDDLEINGSLLQIHDSQTLGLLVSTIWGKTHIVCGIPPVASKWSDDGRYLAFPSPLPGVPEFSMRVFDTADDSIAFDLIFPDDDGRPVGVKYIHKVPNTDILWATVHSGTPAGLLADSDYVVRINTSTQGFEVFEVEGGDNLQMADFAVSPDCSTLYLTKPYTGEVIVFTAPNAPPVCALFVITPMPYQGPSPAAIVFDAMLTYDPNECDTLTFEWDFDGDRIFSEPGDDDYTGDPDNPTHEYTSDYDGPVHLRVTDNHGASSICSVPIIVEIV